LDRTYSTNWSCLKSNFLPQTKKDCLNSYQRLKQINNLAHFLLTCFRSKDDPSKHQWPVQIWRAHLHFRPLRSRKEHTAQSFGWIQVSLCSTTNCYFIDLDSVSLKFHLKMLFTNLVCFKSYIIYTTNTLNG
jgi:hypothetical protein